MERHNTTVKSSIHSNEAIHILQTVSHYGRCRQGAYMLDTLYQNLSEDIVRASQEGKSGSASLHILLKISKTVGLTEDCYNNLPAVALCHTGNPCIYIIGSFCSQREGFFSVIVRKLMASSYDRSRCLFLYSISFAPKEV